MGEVCTRGRHRTLHIANTGLGIGGRRRANQRNAAKPVRVALRAARGPRERTEDWHEILGITYETGRDAQVISLAPRIPGRIVNLLVPLARAVAHLGVGVDDHVARRGGVALVPRRGRTGRVAVAARNGLKVAGHQQRHEEGGWA